MKNKNAVKKNGNPSFWTEATLILVDNHRTNGKLNFIETIIGKQNIKKNNERIWFKEKENEEYQIRINQLLEEGKVVIREVG